MIKISLDKKTKKLLINFLVKVSMFENNERTKEEWESYYKNMAIESLEVFVLCYGGQDKLELVIKEGNEKLKNK